MDPLQLNIELSKEIYEQLKDRLKVKMCYNNTFYVTEEYTDRVSAEEWLVAYGFMKVINNLYTRHAFLIDTTTNQVIDPTVFTQTTVQLNQVYYPFVTMRLDEYLTKLQEGNLDPTLERSFIEQEKVVRNFLTKQKCMVI